MRPGQHRVYGDTNGDQSNYVYLLMTLSIICWETTCSSLGHDTLKNIKISQKIERERNMLELIWNRIMKKEPVEQLWMDISWISETNMDI